MGLKLEVLVRDRIFPEWWLEVAAAGGGGGEGGEEVGVAQLGRNGTQAPCPDMRIRVCFLAQGQSLPVWEEG